jgi:hypothetical protein
MAAQVVVELLLLEQMARQLQEAMAEQARLPAFLAARSLTQAAVAAVFSKEERRGLVVPVAVALVVYRVTLVLLEPLTQAAVAVVEVTQPQLRFLLFALVVPVAPASSF